jgi:type II secretory pathway pseudopilin PulG
MKRKEKKRSVTLIEIMIVILLIGLIGGALAFNMRGSLEKGKVFKTEQNCAKVREALLMAYTLGEFEIKNCSNAAAVKEALENSPFIKDVDKVLVDGWGELLLITLKGNDDIEVTSRHMSNQEPPKEPPKG